MTVPTEVSTDFTQSCQGNAQVVNKLCLNRILLFPFQFASHPIL
jgi:hypothetical protein